MKVSPEEFQKRTLNSKALLVKSEEIIEKSKQLEENLLYFENMTLNLNLMVNIMKLLKL